MHLVQSNIPKSEYSGWFALCGAHNARYRTLKITQPHKRNYNCLTRLSSINFFRHQVYEACRGFQSVFAEAKERSQKALAFAKTLRKDLEVSAEFTPANNDELGSG